jgi:hypothetical protein
MVPILALLAAFVLIPTIATSQTAYGTVVGTVTDSTGAQLPDANVTIVNLGTSAQRSMKSDRYGNYQFMSLLPGEYELAFEKTGFSRLRRDRFDVRVATVTHIDVTMQLGALEQTVEVTAAAPAIDIQSSTVGAVIEPLVVRETALSGRNVMNLIAIAPGVVPQGSSSGSVLSNQHGGTFSNPAGWGNYQIGGGMAGQSAMFVDGQPLNGTQNNSPTIVPAQDIIQEFRVETNTVSPEFGKFAGGVVSMTTKSGANTLHGSVYEYFRNKALNANNFFNNMNGVARPDFNQNQYGLTVGGPLKKDKAFFFVAWEGFHLRLGDPQGTPIPTTAMMQGDFSALPVPILDPRTNQPFAGNIIPQDRWDPTGAYIIQNYYPQNTTGFWSGNGQSGSNYDQITARLDYNLSESHRLFARFTYWNGDTIPTDYFENGYGKPGEKHHTYMFALGDTYTISPTTVADFRVSYTGMTWDSMAPSTGRDMSPYGPNWAALAPSLTYQQNIDPQVVGGPFWGFFMDVTQVSLDKILGFTGSVTKIAGRHTLKLGGELRHTNWRNIATNSASGQFLFTPGIYSGNPWANLLLGLPTEGQTQTVRETEVGMWYGGLYLMDTFRATDKLTINAGLRWEQPGAFNERDDLNTVFLPDVTDPAVGQRGLLPLVNSPDYQSRYDQELKWNLFSPRVGFAYRLTNSTVVKGGFGLSYLPSNSSTSQSPIIGASNSINPGNVFPRIFSNQFFLYNPYPSGVQQPVGRDPGYLSLQYGTRVSTQIPAHDYPYATQWNVSVGQDFGKGLSLEAGYVGSSGTNLPGVGAGGMNINQLPDQYRSMREALLAQVPNPFFGLGPNEAPMISSGQLLLPYPQYQGLLQNRAYWGSTTYNGLVARLQQRFQQGSNVQVAYTWSRLSGNVDSLYGFVEGSTVGGSSGPQDIYNRGAEDSISAFDVTHRLQISYILELPFGKGQRFFGDVHGVADVLLSGWHLNGITTFQTGFPLSFVAQATVLSSQFNAGTPRPNIAAGCSLPVSGSPQSRINGWFNTSCFSEPDPYGFGNAPRVSEEVRADGIQNWDLSLVKKTAITSRTSLEFRVEVFNLFNHVRFAAPNTQLDSGLFGKVTEQANFPRIVQFAARLNF